MSSALAAGPGPFVRRRCVNMDRERHAAARARWLGGVLVVAGFGGIAFEMAAYIFARQWLGAAGLAAGVVLAVVMLGLALGARLGGVLADRTPNPLRLLGIVLLTGMLAVLVTPAVFRLAHPLLSRAGRVTDGAVRILLPLRALIACVALLPACTVLGMVVPVGVRVSGSTETGREVGRCSSRHTLGAGMGALLGAFLLLPFGVRVLWLGAGAGLALAGLAALRGAAVLPARPVPMPGGAWVPAAPVRLANRGVLYGLYGAMGAVLMMYEVAWLRWLGVAFGSSTFAFAVLLAALILGLAWGEAVGGWLTVRVRVPLRFLLGGHLLGALWSLAVLAQADRLSDGLWRGFTFAGESFWMLQAVQWTFGAVLMMPVVLWLGATFPMVCAVGVRPRHFGADVGRMSAAGTLGAALGALVSGFFGIPRFGVFNWLRLAAFLAPLVAAAMLWAVVASSSGRWFSWRGLRPLLPVLALGALLWFLPAPRQPLLSHSAFVRRLRAVQGLGAPSGRLLFHRDGYGAAVSVREMPGGERVIFLNGKPDASSQADYPNQSMLAHIPMFLHPEPVDVLVIGLGSGVTAASALKHSEAVRVVCCELEPSMVQACEWFAETNDDVCRHPRFSLRALDGRFYAGAMRGRFDVIVSQPSNPWVEGMAELFTVQFFRQSARALREGGILCVWLESYGLRETDFRRVLGTIAAVFPHYQVWSAQPGDYLVVARGEPFHASAAEWFGKLENADVFRDLVRSGIKALPDLLSMYIGDETDFGSWVADVRILHDHGASLATSAPRTLLRRAGPSEPVFGAMAARGADDLPWLVAGADWEADLWTALLRRVSRFRAARRQVMAAMADAGDVDGWTERMVAARALNPGDAFLMQLSRRLHADALRTQQNGDAARALDRFRLLRIIRPDWAEAHAGTGRMLLHLDRADEAWPYVREAVRLDPGDAALHALSGDCAWRRNRPREAIAAYALALHLVPADPGLLHNLAWMLATAPPGIGDPDRAVALAREACERTGWREERYVRSLRTIQARIARIENGTDPDGAAQGPVHFDALRP